VKTDPQIDVAHFIPSVTLKGTREQKLRCLDLLIEHLQQVRRSLAEDYFAAVGEIPPMDAMDARAKWHDVRVAGLMLSRHLMRRVCGLFTASSEHRYEQRS